MNEINEQLPNQDSFARYADSFTVGDHSLALISRMREPVEPGEKPSTELAAGDILRRTCKFGGVACAQCCRAPEGYANEVKDCSDQNLLDFVKRAGIDKDELLMVGVTADGVGFYDQLERYKGALKVNSAGIRELPGYNAFFARTSEKAVLGARLADCGFTAIEFQDDEGEDVLGFVHLTRPNLQGESALKFEIDGQSAGSFEYFLHEALEHYGANIDSVKVRLVASVKAENYPFHFSDNVPEDLFPGWFAQGLLKNTSNPDWQPDSPLNPEDVWEPQNREMMRWQIMRSGIQPEQLETEGIIDPADLELGHASNHAGAHGKMPDARDAYMVMPRAFYHEER